MFVKLGQVASKDMVADDRTFDRLKSILETPRLQLWSGLAFAACIVLGVVVWENWSRANMAAAGMLAALGALFLYRYPKFPIPLLVLALTGYATAFWGPSVSVVIAVCLAGAVAYWVRNNSWTLSINQFAGLSLLYFAWQFFTVLWAPDQLSSIPRLHLYTICLVLLLSQVVDSPEDYRRIAAAAGLGMIVSAGSAIYGIYILFSQGLAVEAAGSVKMLAKARYYGHWGGPNQLAHTILPFMGLLVACISICRTRLQRFYYTFCVCAGVICIALSLSRAALLGLFVILCVTVAVSLYRRLLATAFLAAIMLTIFTLPVDLIGRVGSFVEGRRDASFNSRTYVMAAGVSLMEEKFPWGGGFGSYYAEHQDYIPFTFQVNHAHNTYLQLLVDYGVVGLVLFALVIASLFAAVSRVFKIRDRQSSSYQLGVACFATLLGLLVASPFEDFTAWPPYWIAFTLISLYPAVFSAEQLR